MKNIITLILLILIASSCKCYKREKFTYSQKDNAWIDAYKYEVFYSCLRKGINNDSIFKIMSKKDFFNPYDNVEIDVRKKARELGENIIINLTAPIVPHCDDCDDNSEIGKNYISNNCLKYYASRELDSIAKSAYKLHLKREKDFNN